MIAKDGLGEGPLREEAGVRFIRTQGVSGIALRQVNLIIREIRILEDIGQDVERCLGSCGEHFRADDQSVLLSVP